MPADSTPHSSIFQNRILDLHSTLEGVKWPPMPNDWGARLVTLSAQFQETQWLSPAEIRKGQMAQAATLLQHAWSTTRFYRERFDATDFSPRVFDADDDWSRIPVTTREELQLAGDAALSDTPPPEHGHVQTRCTSGSTGRPLPVSVTQLNYLFWCAATLRDHWWHERDFRRTRVAIREVLDRDIPRGGLWCQSWDPAVDGLLPTGRCLLVDVRNTSVQEQAAILAEVDPGYLITYPSNVRALCDEFARTGCRRPGLLGVQTFGELLPAGVRDLCREVWNALIADTYSSAEAGYIALQCPSQGTYHAMSESLLVEILDDRGNPCAPGESGQVVVTTLHNFAMPLIRYQIGDYAEVGEPCACGRGLTTLKRIVGRQRNILTLPDGRKIWPSTGSFEDFVAAMGSAPPPLQMQVVQSAVDHLDVRLVGQRPYTTEEEARGRDYLRRVLDWPFEVTYNYVSNIPRQPGGKYEDFRSDIS